MDSAVTSRILLCGATPATVADLRALLEQAGYPVSWQSLDADPGDLLSYQVVILDGSPRDPAALPCCRRLRLRLGEGFVPILLVTDDPVPAARLAGLEAGADTYLLRPFAPGELLAQVRALVRIKAVHDRLTEKTHDLHRINRQLQSAYEQLELELDLARRIQLSLLPQTLPEVPRVRFAVHYRPAGRVGGDFYDVFRLDEEHLGFYIADAMGHGVPASLLTIFIKKGIRAKEIFGREYRLVPPDEVLERLNRDLLEQALSENPFITMVYVLFNSCDGTLRFARAGHPHPLYLPPAGEPELWRVPGSLLGVFDTGFPARTCRLRPGDKVILYTDGLDSASFEDHPVGIDSLVACAARHRALPIQDLVARLSRDLFAQTGPPDDLTLLGLEVGE